jgi:hypothetical protein
MHYYIDGYNMLFRHLPTRKLKIERENLLDEIYQITSLLNLNISIIFDAAFQVGGRRKSHLDSLEILYSAEGETADEYIIDIVSHIANPRSIVVVTNDRSLAAQVRHYSAKVESVELFMQRVKRSYQKRLFHPKKPINKSVEEKKIVISPPITEDLLSQVPIKPPNERDLDYYQRIFEEEYKQIIEEKEKVKDAKRSSKKTRKPKKYTNPFQEGPNKPKKEANELDRWLKAFENRNNYPKDIFDLD